MKKVFPSPCLLAVILMGCGGGGMVASNHEKAGRATMEVVWPDRSTRLIPNASNSLTVTLTLGGKVEAQKTIVRPAGSSKSSVDFGDLDIGTFQVSVAAYPTTTGKGVVQASGQGTMVVGVSSPGSIVVSLASTVASLRLQPTTPFLPLNSAATITATAYDKSGAMVLLSTQNGQEILKWTTDKPNVGAISMNLPTVIFKSSRASGLVKVTASLKTTDGGSTVTGNCAIGVGPTPSGLATSSFPKTHGDSGNTGRGKGKGSTGVLNWSKSIGSAPVGTVVLGSDKTIYASCGGAVVALDSTGNTLWSKTLSGTVSGLLLTQDGQLFVGADAFTSLDAKTGNIIWNFTTDKKCFEPNINWDGSLIFLSTAGSTYALSTLSHSVAWHNASIVPSQGATVAADGTLVVSNASTVEELDPAKGSVIARQDAGSGMTYSIRPLANEDSIFTIAQDQSGKTVNESFTSSGAPIWTQTTTQFYSGIAEAVVSPLETYAVWPFSSFDHTHPLRRNFSYGIANGNSKWNQYGSSGSPVIVSESRAASVDAGGIAYIYALVSAGRCVVAVNADSGATSWSLPVSSSICEPAIGPNGELYVGTGDGKVIALH